MSSLATMESDDSDFYGSDEIKAGLRSRVGAFNVADWWEERRDVNPGPSPHATDTDDTPRLHNPYAGCSYAWQLNETVDAFLARLPPSTTDSSPTVPWIYICNPYIARKAKIEGDNQRSRGNEDEAPEEEGSQLGSLLEEGMDRLNDLKDAVQAIQQGRKTKVATTREVNKEKAKTVQEVLAMAQKYHIRCGKWMLFCGPEDVDDVWEVIAKATANNELGIAAKVAPRQEESMKKEHVVVIYTADFADKKDVERVLQKLRELRLVESRGRPIYYKPGKSGVPSSALEVQLTEVDAFTYLGIAYGNTWDLKASIYSSMDFLGKQSQ